MEPEQSVIKKSIEANVAVIKEATKTLPEDMPEDTRAHWSKIPEQVEMAIGLASQEETETNEIYALGIVEDATSKYANQICFYLFRHDLLTDNLTKMFRAIRTPEQTTADMQERDAPIKEQENSLRQEQEAYTKRQDRFDVIAAVVGGLSKEEAEKRIKHQREAALQAMGRG